MRLSTTDRHRGVHGGSTVSCDVDAGVENGSGAVPVGGVSVDDERGGNSGACVTGGGAEGDPEVAPGTAPDGDVAWLVRLDDADVDKVGEVDRPMPPVALLGIDDVDHLTSESRMLIGAGGGGISAPPGIVAEVDEPGAGVHGRGAS